MYRVGIIGLGSIAARYSKPDDRYPYCHTGGIRQCEKTELVAVADLSKERREEFQTTWGPAFPEGSIRYYETEKQMLESETLDIVAVCVRGPHHFSVMQNVLKADIKAIFLEKPAGCSLQEVDEMTADAKGVPIIVDYSRRWAPRLLRLQTLVQEGLIGEVQSVIGYCGGTVLSFAIHTTDLICQFAGYDPVSATAFVQPGGGNVPAPYEPEPAAIGSTICFKSGVQGFHVGKHGSLAAFSVDVLGSRKSCPTGTTFSEGRQSAGMYIETAVYNGSPPYQGGARGGGVPRRERTYLP
jgi:predicted dehydrogenase